ncbi:MAG TPA: hypothetical protein VMH81_21340 [Bryobacteraceae bacterium]|nr:hypothetical protein [Bryobacteraceae bacterium]
MRRLLGACIVALPLLYHCAQAQVIEFESNGLKYQALTRSGVTVMFAPMPAHLHEYAIIQVAVSNGSAGPYVIRPEDFSYVRQNGEVIKATPSHTVINMLFQKGSGNDVVKLVQAYEAGVYGNPHLRSTNGYEQRRLAALAMSATRVRSAAIASALTLVQAKLAQGESTDGAVFFVTEGKPLGPGHLVVRTNTDTFEFLAASE